MPFYIRVGWRECLSPRFILVRWIGQEASHDAPSDTIPALFAGFCLGVNSDGCEHSPDLLFGLAV